MARARTGLYQQILEQGGLYRAIHAYNKGSTVQEQMSILSRSFPTAPVSVLRRLLQEAGKSLVASGGYNEVSNRSPARASDIPQSPDIDSGRVRIGIDVKIIPPGNTPPMWRRIVDRLPEEHTVEDIERLISEYLADWIVRYNLDRGIDIRDVDWKVTSIVRGQ